MMIKLEDLRKYCMSKKGASEDFPFDLTTLAFKVCGKIFALTDITSEVLSVNLKCRPEHAIQLRALYPQVTPGYHMNKKHWNTVLLDRDITDKDVFMMIDESYELVLAGVKKSLRDELI